MGFSRQIGMADAPRSGETQPIGEHRWLADRRYDLVILGGGSGGYACALRAAELGMSRRPGREGQGRRHLPAPRLHPDQGAAARRRGRRRRPRERSSSASTATFEGIDMAGVNKYKDGVVASSTRACRAWSRAAASRSSRARAGWSPPTAVAGRRHAYDGEHVVLATGSVASRCPASRSTASGSSPATHALQLDRVPASVDRARRRRDRRRVRQRLDAPSAPR